MNKLIKNIENGIANKSDFINTIRNPKLLVRSLKDLNGMIGNDNIKDKVATQIIHLMAQKYRDDNKPIMLHSLLYGPPGTGKTTVGIHLARIWYALGYIDGTKKKPEKSGLMDGLTSGDAESMENLQTTMIIMTLIILLISILSYIVNTVKKCYEFMGIKWFFIGVSILALILIVLLFLYGTNVFDQSSTNSKANVHTQTTSDDAPVNSQYFPMDDDIISIVGRDQLVERYVGWSAKKTKEVLEKNIGKVLFIDEAYSLVNSTHDSFGIEVLDTINKFMSENPGKIIVIFAGYKDKIINNLFSVQPGLKRRFGWAFECNGYEPEELFEIFKQQILPWKMDDEGAIRELFVSHGKKVFPNHAGDTLRLVNYTQIAHSTAVFEGEITEKDILTIEHIRKGLKTLLENTVDEEGCKGDNKNEIQELLKKFAF